MITADEYTILDNAYSYFNQTLFSGELPDALIILDRGKQTKMGHYMYQSFESRTSQTKLDEIALNLESFKTRTDRDILSTLVHEMAHLWQFNFGKPARNGYHDRQWGKKMQDIGLMPSNTGQPGGKKTGQQMTHYIIEGGPFDLACSKLLADQPLLNWNTIRRIKHKRPESKVKFTCGTCQQNAWAKPSASLMCGNCQEPMDRND